MPEIITNLYFNYSSLRKQPLRIYLPKVEPIAVKLTPMFGAAKRSILLPLGTHENLQFSIICMFSIICQP